MSDHTLRASAILCLILAAGACLSFGAQETIRPEDRVRLLENELAAAKSGASYTVIDFASKSISLKNRGMILKSWDIVKWTYWGWPIANGLYKLESKSALDQPVRPNITPGKEDKKSVTEKKAEPDLGVLELRDMPVRFDLFFGRNIRVVVKTAVKGFWPSLLGAITSLPRRAALPIRTLWGALLKKPFTRIEIVVPAEKDAQGIYWTFLDGESTIIYRPVMN